METEGGNIPLARAYLERVANSNAEEVNAATELLRKLNSTGPDAVSNETQPPSSAVTATTISTVASGETSAPPTS